MFQVNQEVVFAAFRSISLWDELWTLMKSSTCPTPIECLLVCALCPYSLICLMYDVLFIFYNV